MYETTTILLSLYLLNPAVAIVKVYTKNKFPTTTMSFRRTTARPPHLVAEDESPSSNSTKDETPCPTLSEFMNPLLTPSEINILETVHSRLDKLLSPTLSPETLTSLLKEFRPLLNTTHTFLPIALQQRVSTLQRQVRLATTALAQANRIQSRLEHLRKTLQETSQPTSSQQQRDAVHARLTPNKPLKQRLVEVLGGKNEYANYLDTEVLANIRGLKNKAEVEKGQLERLLVVVRSVLDSFWGIKQQWRGGGLWALFLAEGEVRVAIMNLWAVEEVNRVWVIKAVEAVEAAEAMGAMGAVA